MHHTPFSPLARLDGKLTTYPPSFGGQAASVDQTTQIRRWRAG